jgi:hypothetical protein
MLEDVNTVARRLITNIITASISLILMAYWLSVI